LVPALFSRFRAFMLASGKPKKERESAKKSESAERERKKREFVLFLPPTVEIRF
jgi:hypothetical protein